jgi:hypothetical protein
LLSFFFLLGKLNDVGSRENHAWMLVYM